MKLLNSHLLPRRTLLKAAGAALALPLLEAMVPAGARAAEATKTPKRMLLVGRALGMHAPFLFPDKVGRDYELTPYLKQLADHRNEFSIISGMSHPGYANGHSAYISLFTGAPWEGIKDPAHLRNTVSVDQVAVEIVGNSTRYPCLVLGGDNCSWNRAGTRLPHEGTPGRVYQKLFVDPTAAEQKQIMRDLDDGRSVLDRVRSEAKRLERQVGPGDRDRMDQYFTSVREAEERLKLENDWAKRLKPKVDMKAPKASFSDNELLDRTRTWYNLIHLAFQTDSTRIVALWIHSHGSVLINGKPTAGHHDLSHHGQDEEKIKQLAEIESNELAELSSLLTKLKESKEAGGRLIDNTMVFHGSNLSNANSHSNVNLPILLAGGGFKHGQHLAYDQKNNRPLNDLYLTMLQRFGVETSEFGGHRSTVSELV